MSRVFTRSFFFVGSFIACAIMALTTGCASGGYKLTRQYAGWINSQNIIIRIVLYILTSVVFFVTLLIDVVINNTMDFWEGRVSAGDFEFKEGGKTYQVRHEFIEGTQLKRSTIRITESAASTEHVLVLNETPSGEIELFIDGKLRTRVSGISAIPVASTFDDNGHLIQENILWLAHGLAQAPR